MRLLLLIFALFIPGPLIVEASPIAGNIENIDLNLKDREAAVTFFNLSKGEAALIQGSGGLNILINTGGKGTQAELESWLGLYNVKKISTLILTHNNSNDDFGKMYELIAKYDTKEIFTTPVIAARVARVVDPQKVKVTAWVEGAKKEINPNFHFEVQFAGSERNEGLDFTMIFFKQRIFFMSSFSESAERVLLSKHLEDINVLKIPNCAKETSLSEKLIQFLNPQISILSVLGEGEPDSDTLYHLYNTWSEVYFTKRHGTMTIKFTDSKYEIITIPVKDDE